MALAPADFYAYSRATGVPVPENPEERAALAPEVLAFRRGQLQAPQQESSLPGILGAAAVGLGALAGGAYAAKRFGLAGRPAKEAPLSREGTQKVQEIGTIAKQRAAEQATRQAREERPQGIVQTDLSRSVMPTEAEAMQSYSAQLSQMFPEPTASEMEALGAPSRTARILARLGTQPQYRPDPKDINYARFGPVSKEVAEARRTQATEDLLRFAQQRQEDAALGATQTLGALESGEDQMTGRVMRGVLRNEDLDASQVNAAAKQTGDVEVAASLTPDGLPVDQTEGAQSFVKSFIANQRQEIASEMGEQNLPINPRVVDEELSRRLGKESYEYGSEYTKVKQMIEAGLEDPRYLESQKAEPLKTRMVSGEEFPVSVQDVMSNNPELAFRKPFISQETAIASERQFQEEKNEIKDWLGNIRVEVAPQINKLLKQQELLGEEHNMLMYSLNKQPDAQLRERFVSVSNQLKDIDNKLGFLNRRLEGATAAAQESLESVEKWTPTTLVDWSGEGTVVRPKRTAPDTYSYESEGGEVSNIERGARMAQLGPEDLEIVPGGLLSGGRARSVPNIGQQVGFDPATGEATLVPLVDPNTGEAVVQKLAGKRMGEDIGVRGRGGVAGLDTKASIGIYGPELSEYGTSAQTKTGEYTTEASQVPSLVNPQPVQKATGGYFTYPKQREATPEKYQQEVTPERLSSVRMSEAILKANRLQAARNPRGGVLPDEMTRLRRQLSMPQGESEPTYGPRGIAPAGSIPPQQLSLKGVSGYKARQVKSPADAAAEQLESYMSKLQRGRATPLTSEAVIQPRLF